MDKNKIKEFFDDRASSWDENMIKDDKIMNTILDNVEVSKGKDILDVACGTGVMIDYYLDREVKSITGVDFSNKMCEIASNKYKNNNNVKIVCEDIEKYKSDIKYDVIVIYNSFPHFVNGEKLIEYLSNLLKEDGFLTIAHGMSRDKINAHHLIVSSDVRTDLIQAEKLGDIFSKYLEVTTIISNEKMYQVVGKKV